MKNNGITVKELYDHLADVIEKGYGNKHILISTDEEGNGYHPLFFGVTTDYDQIKMCANWGLFTDNNDPDIVVLLG